MTPNKQVLGVPKPSWTITKVLQLCLTSTCVLVAGVSGSLLNTFYSKVAGSKGVSVASSGQVFGSMYLAVIATSLFQGRYLGSLYGPRGCLVVGLVICTVG